MAISHGLPSFLVPAAQVPKQTSFCQSQLKAHLYNNDNAVQWLLLPQACCGIVEDLRVYVVIVGVIWPAGKWHHHILSQGRKCCCNKFLFQIIRRWHVPQQALDWQKLKHFRVRNCSWMHPNDLRCRSQENFLPVTCFWVSGECVSFSSCRALAMPPQCWTSILLYWCLKTRFLKAPAAARLTAGLGLRSRVTRAGIPSNCKTCDRQAHPDWRPRKINIHQITNTQEFGDKIPPSPFPSGQDIKRSLKYTPWDSWSKCNHHWKLM